MKDLIGKAILSYHLSSDDTPVETFIDDEEDAKMPPSLFFRPLIRMNHLERIALKTCKGKILDVGAGAGCHSLILQKQGFEITALEISKNACEVMKARGIMRIVNTDLYKYSEKSDTILLLMNGFGLARTKEALYRFIKHLKSLLNPNGQIIGDSTDIRYHQKEDINVSDKYYGEVEFQLRYQGEKESFNWLYADDELIKEAALANGLKYELLQRNKSDAFLVRLSN